MHKMPFRHFAIRADRAVPVIVHPVMHKMPFRHFALRADRAVPVIVHPVMHEMPFRHFALRADRAVPGIVPFGVVAGNGYSTYNISPLRYSPSGW